MLHEETKTKVAKKLYCHRFGYKVYLVDGESVRNQSHSDEEFGGVCIHPQFPELIPTNEIWIERDSRPEEIPILIETAAHQLRLLAKGANQNDAYQAAIKHEKKLREALKLTSTKRKKRNRKVPSDVYIKLYKKLSDDTKVWLVDGEKVRDLYKTDYTQGGHSVVYDFIPDGEIWLEYGLDPEEIPFILYHELFERTLMTNKHMSYDKAHVKAANAEYKARENCGLAA